MFQSDMEHNGTAKVSIASVAAHTTAGLPPFPEAFFNPVATAAHHTAAYTEHSATLYSGNTGDTPAMSHNTSSDAAMVADDGRSPPHHASSTVTQDFRGTSI